MKHFWSFHSIQRNKLIDISINRNRSIVLDEPVIEAIEGSAIAEREEGVSFSNL